MPFRVNRAKIKRLAEKYREGIAEAIGVPPEAIREDVVEKRVEEWVKAFTKPEFWNVIFGNSDHPAKEAGRQMGYLLKDLGRKYPEIFRSETYP